MDYTKTQGTNNEYNPISRAIISKKVTCINSIGSIISLLRTVHPDDVNLERKYKYI